MIKLMTGSLDSGSNVAAVGCELDPESVFVGLISVSAAFNQKEVLLKGSGEDGRPVAVWVTLPDNLVNQPTTMTGENVELERLGSFLK